MNLALLRAEWRAVRRASLRLMHQSLSMVGLFAVAACAIVAMHPEYARAMGHWFMPVAEAPQPAPPASPPLGAGLVERGSEAGRMLGLVSGAAPADAAQPAQGDAPPAVTLEKVATGERPATAREKREAANYLSKKYHVNSDAVAMLVDAAYTTGHELDLDPLLLLSVIGVESGFNPFAESNAGASGLMQLMAKVHRDKLADFGGANIALNPVVSLRVGAVVLKDCIRRGGSMADGLRLYVGAGTGADSGYGLRVLQEKDKLAQVVRGGSRPQIEAIPSTTAAKARVRQPDIDHSFDNVDPSDPKIQAAGSVAAL